MAKFFTKNNFHVIGLSLISSIIFMLVLEPIIHIGKDIASKGWGALVDYFFYSCAHISGDEMLGFIMFSFYFLPIMALVTYQVVNTFRIVKKTDKITKYSNVSLEVLMSNEAFEALPKKTKSLKRESKILIVLTAVNVFMSSLLLVNILVFQYLPISLKAKFDRQIIQITPYVEVEKIDLLKSNWVSMEEKDDYVLIVNEINQVLEKNNLPK